MSKMSNSMFTGSGMGNDMRRKPTTGGPKPFKPTTGGPMPKFQMPGSMGGTTPPDGADKNMAKKQAIQKKLLGK